MTRFALTLEFDGTPFMGLQRQSHGPSVQQAVEEAATAVTGEEVRLHSAGRTDTGVHALAMRSHFDLEKEITPFRLMVGRRYVYRIINRRAPLTLEMNRAWQVPQDLDHEAMHRAAQALVGKHDFTTFRSAHCQANDPVKSLDQLDVERDGEEVRVHAAARSFLHHQVRSMVGCLALVGMGRWREEQVAKALAARDRQELGFNAPPDGLYFVEATYPDDA
jgi:tRNA pseudouridine38-40 synthase